MKLQVSNIYKSYGEHDILQGASLVVKNTEKIGLVGRNGCGKTTLLKILTGEEDADRGERFLPNASRIGSLSQTVFEDRSITAGQALAQVFEPLHVLEKQLADQAAVLAEDSSPKQLEKFDRIQNRYEIMGGYEWEHELRSVFFHFGFTEEDLNKPLDEFSSGQQTRIALVRLLLEKPDVLLLDEPTNHLDVESIEWLESYISHYPCAVIVVSHDRMFLEKVCTEIVEIEFGKTTRWEGSYTHYVKAKEDWLEKNHDAWVRQQQEIEKISKQIEKFRYKASKASFAQSKIKYLERMERIEDVKSDSSRMKAEFTSGRKGGNRVLEVDSLVCGYDSPLCKVSLELFRQDRMGIVGPNGIGKSTFVKTLMQKIPPLAGHAHFGHQIDPGYFDQETAASQSSQSVLDALWDDHPMASQTEIRSTLARFLFTGSEVFKEVADLSGGEKVCLSLARLMMDHDNFLILDEPTNHLDIPAREALEKALEKFDGTLLFVSHDRMFLSKMATRILEIGPQSQVYAMGYDEYASKRKEGTLPNASAMDGGVKAVKAQEPKLDSNALRMKKKQLSAAVARLEGELEKAQEQLDALNELRYDPAYYEDYRKMEQLEAQMEEKQKEIESKTSQWEEKAAQLEEIPF